jgi:hypothetical protein
MKNQRIWNSLVSGINCLKKSVSALGPYKDVITVVSALVVLASFVVKDAWGEHLKRLVDATQVAESRFESDSRWVEERVSLAKMMTDFEINSLRTGL